MHERLRFTIEISNDNRLNFLDVTVILHEHFIFDRYSKPISDKYLSFYSNHPICYKKGVVYDMIDKILLLSHSQFHKKKFQRYHKHSFR